MTKADIISEIAEQTGLQKKRSFRCYRVLYGNRKAEHA